MEDPFAVKELRFRQPAKMMPGRARYDIFDSRKKLLAVVSETSPRSILQTMADLVPKTRSLAMRSATGEPMLTMVKSDNDWLAEVTDADGRLIGQIQIGGTRRHYTLLDAAGEVAGQVVGDPVVVPLHEREHRLAGGGPHAEGPRPWDQRGHRLHRRPGLGLGGA